VEQNSVATLVEAKPEERRQFIEEAAGVSKYKSRKEAAMRRMEQTQQNLSRVHDITREVKSRLSAVSRQAKRAEQFKDLKQGIREAEITLALQICGDLSREREVQAASLAVAQDREMALQTQIETGEAALSALKVDMMEAENRLSRMQESLYSVRNAVSAKEQAIAHATQQMADLSARMQKDLREVELIRVKQQEDVRELQNLEALKGQLQSRIEELRSSVAQKRQELEERKRRQQSLYTELDQKKIFYVDVAADKAKHNNMLSGLKKGIEDLQRRDERDHRELIEQGKRREDLRLLLDRLANERQAAQAAFSALTEEAGLAVEAQQQERESLEEIEEEIAAVKEDLGRKSARLASLQEFHERYEGCQDGVKSLMGADRQDTLTGLSRDVFCGLVADAIDVPRQYETAVEAVLGDKLQYIVVKKQEDGLRAIDYLKHYSLGRGSFVPLEVRQHASAGDVSEYEHLKGAVRLMDQVRVPEDFKDIADYLLGDVLLIPSLPKGISLWRQNGFRGTFVTPDGDIISPQGVLTGGNGKNGETSLLRNRREIAELQADLKELEDALRSGMERKKQAGARILDWEEECRRLRAESHSTEMEIAGKKKDLERFEDELQRLEQRIGVLVFNREQAKIEESEAATRMQDVRQALAALEDSEKNLNERMTALQSQWDALREDLETDSASLTAEQVLLGSLEEKRDAALKALARLEQDHAQRDGDIAARTADAAAGKASISVLTAAVALDREALGGHFREYERMESVLAQQKDAQRVHDTTLRQQEARVGDLKKARDQAVSEVHEREMASREISLKIENLCRNIQSRYDCDLNPVMQTFTRLDEAAEASLKMKLEKDRRILEQFGEVNLLALSEHEELKERFEFLTAQATDLHASLETLKQTISRINAVTRERFAETFAAVNACFRDMFSRIFPGGRGELRLTDDADMLETGVDIDIQIPGKKAQNISLLSGGEKSLAAIALIFAIILYRPTPYLILDEVDAALDDANILLFNRLIKDISANSQIVMITHNKRTMEAASHLFGVTMQNDGISMLVSVSLN
jgi:chromosome segregation protein